MTIATGEVITASDMTFVFHELDGSLTKTYFTSNTWVDWDLSGTIPAGAKAVLFQVTGNNGNMRANGSALAKTALNGSVTPISIAQCDSSRVVETNTFSAGTNTTFSILGYWGV